MTSSARVRPRLRQSHPAPNATIKKSPPNNTATTVVAATPVSFVTRAGEGVGLVDGESVSGTRDGAGDGVAADACRVGCIVSKKRVGAADGWTLGAGDCVETGSGDALAGVPIFKRNAAKSYPPALAEAHAPDVAPATRTWVSIALEAKATPLSFPDVPFCGFGTDRPRQSLVLRKTFECVRRRNVA